MQTMTELGADAETPVRCVNAIVSAEPRAEQAGWSSLRGWDPYVKLQGETHSRLKLWKARSRLYRRRFLRPNTHFSAFYEIYKILIPSHRSDLKTC